jgi:hypothetical protein
MSKIALSGDPSGTGTFTIASPNSNSNFTLTLPAATGTVLTSATTTGFPAGSVLQVVTATTSTQVTTSTQNTWVDSGLSASITPSSVNSKILIIVSQNIGIDGVSSGDQQANLGIFRNTTLIFGQIGFDDLRIGSVVDFVFRVGISYLDSPATTSSVTYKTAGSLRQEAASGCKMQYGSNPSSIILLEIAG